MGLENTSGSPTIVTDSSKTLVMSIYTCQAYSRLSPLPSSGWMDCASSPSRMTTSSEKLYHPTEMSEHNSSNPCVYYRLQAIIQSRHHGSSSFLELSYLWCRQSRLFNIMEAPGIGSLGIPGPCGGLEPFLNIMHGGGSMVCSFSEAELATTDGTWRDGCDEICLKHHHRVEPLDRQTDASAHDKPNVRQNIGPAPQLRSTSR